MKQYPIYPADRYDDFASFIEGIGLNFATQPAITVFQADGTPRTRTYTSLRLYLTAKASASTPIAHSEDQSGRLR
jgi:hypothetical protein